jgi:putative endonuclease
MKEGFSRMAEKTGSIRKGREGRTKASDFGGAGAPAGAPDPIARGGGAVEALASAPPAGGGPPAAGDGAGHFVYVIRSAEGRYYIGSTQDVEKRLRQHNAKANRGWTNRFTGWELVYREERPTRLDARRRERALKNMRGTKAYWALLGMEPPAKKPASASKRKPKPASGKSASQKTGRAPGAQSEPKSRKSPLKRKAGCARAGKKGGKA